MVAKKRVIKIVRPGKKEKEEEVVNVLFFIIINIKGGNVASIATPL